MVREAEIFARSDWQMALGERAALEGVLAELSPELAIEIGTAEGGSPARIAAHSGEVHAIDLTRQLLVDWPANARFHQGDSRGVVGFDLDFVQGHGCVASLGEGRGGRPMPDRS